MEYYVRLVAYTRIEHSMYGLRSGNYPSTNIESHLHLDVYRLSSMYIPFKGLMHALLLTILDSGCISRANFAGALAQIRDTPNITQTVTQPGKRAKGSPSRLRLTAVELVFSAV
jgi:hypothetical protein